MILNLECFPISYKRSKFENTSPEPAGVGVDSRGEAFMPGGVGEMTGNSPKHIQTIRYRLFAGGRFFAVKGEGK
jgi:hypothetical protein